MTFSQIYSTAEVRRLPVDPVYIARMLGIRVIDYKAAARHFELEPSRFYPYAPLGFSFKEGRYCCIALNENSCGEQRRRFTAAHELAHCILGHLDGGRFSRRQEHDAERFAAELLAPLVVLHDCRIHSTAEIARVCGISESAAVNRLSCLAARERRGFRPCEDELRTSEIFREFSESIIAPSKNGYRKNLYIRIN